MKSPSPAFSLYPKDILSDENAAAMTLEERGAYLTLLCHAWLEGSIPKDPVRLARLLGVRVAKLRKLWPAIEPCWSIDPSTESRLIQSRLEKERDQQRERSRKQSERGQKGGRPLGSTKSKTRGLFTVKPDKTQPKPEKSLPSPSASPHTTDVPSEQGAGAPVVDDPFSPPPPVTTNGRKDWPTRVAALYLVFYPKATVPPPMFKALKPLVDKHGHEAVETELDAYLRGTEITYHNWSKFAAGFGSWAAPSTALAARGSPAAPRGAAARAANASANWLRDKQAERQGADERDGGTTND